LPPLQDFLGDIVVPDTLLTNLGWLFIDIYDQVSSWLAACGGLDYASSKALVERYALDGSHMDLIVSQLGGSASDSPEQALLKLFRPSTKFPNLALYENIFGTRCPLQQRDMLFAEPPTHSAASA